MKNSNDIGFIKVIHCANDDVFDIAGASVATLKTNLRDAFNVPADALGEVNGAFVKDSYRLRPNDVLEFMKCSGIKSVLDPDEKALLIRIEAMLSQFFGKPANIGSPGRSTETHHIAVLVNQLRQQNKTWKEILRACQERWPGDPHVKNTEQVRATYRRFFKQKVD